MYDIRSHRVAPSSRDCNLFFHGRATVMGNNSSSSEKQAFLRMCELGKLKDIHDLWEVHRHETTNEKTKERFLSLADANGMTGLHLACEAGHTDIVKFLALGCSSLLDYVTIRGNTPLHIAARSNRPDCVKILLRAANQGSWEQCRLLWIALRKDRHTNPSCAFARFNKDEIRLLCQYIMRESDALNRVILFRNNENMIPLEYALKNQARECVPLLITPATVKQIRGVLGSPLHYAAAKGSPEAVALLLRMRDNVNELNERNETPLFRACCAFPESAETVKLLLSHGADASIRANTGNSAVDESDARKYYKSSELIRNKLHELSLK